MQQACASFKCRGFFGFYPFLVTIFGRMQFFLPPVSSLFFLKFPVELFFFPFLFFLFFRSVSYGTALPCRAFFLPFEYTDSAPGLLD